MIITSSNHQTYQTYTGAKSPALANGSSPSNSDSSNFNYQNELSLKSKYSNQYNPYQNHDINNSVYSTLIQPQYPIDLLMNQPQQQQYDYNSSQNNYYLNQQELGQQYISQAQFNCYEANNQAYYYGSNNLLIANQYSLHNNLVTQQTQAQPSNKNKKRISEEDSKSSFGSIISPGSNSICSTDYPLNSNNKHNHKKLKLSKSDTQKEHRQSRLTSFNSTKKTPNFKQIKKELEEQDCLDEDDLEENEGIEEEDEELEEDEDFEQGINDKLEQSQQTHEPKKRVTANKKERRRTQSINNAFSDLRNRIPQIPTDTKLSKIKTLKLAINYIEHLMKLLQENDPNSLEPFKPDLGKLRRECRSKEIKLEVERKTKGRTGWPSEVWSTELKKKLNDSSSSKTKSTSSSHQVTSNNFTSTSSTHQQNFILYNSDFKKFNYFSLNNEHT